MGTLCGCHESTTATSGILSWYVWPTVDCEPQMHITVDCGRLKLSQARSQLMIVLYAMLSSLLALKPAT